MNYKKIGKDKVSSIGIGTWGMGGWMYKDESQDPECIYAIKTAVKLGMTHIDTAEVYGNGHAEELVGRAIKGINRKKLFITSKVYRNHLHYNDVINAAKKSLERLGTDYMDLYLVHWPNPNVSLRETMKAMDYLVKKDIVRHIGVSNFKLAVLKHAEKCTRNRIAANQVEYNLLKRDYASKLLEYCREKGIMLIAYQPLAGGRLGRKGYKVLDELALKYGKAQAQVAINWLISQENVITIPKAVVPKHVRENALAAGWKMSAEDHKRLGDYFVKFWLTSKYLGKPLRFAKDTVIRALPEKQAEKLTLFYDSTIKKVGRAQKRILSR